MVEMDDDQRLGYRCFFLVVWGFAKQGYRQPLTIIENLALKNMAHRAGRIDAEVAHSASFKGICSTAKAEDLAASICQARPIVRVLGPCIGWDTMRGSVSRRK